MILFEYDTFMCKICDRLIDDPRVLPCGDSVCFGCIPADCQIYKCQVCSSDHQVPKEGFIVNKVLVKSLEKTFHSDKIKKYVSDCKFKIKEIDDELEEILNFSPEIEISNHCSDLINAIDLSFEDRMAKMADLRIQMIQRVKDYEKQCIEKFNQKNKTEFESQLENIKKISQKMKICCQESIVCNEDICQFDLLNSKFIEYSNELKRNIFDNIHLSFSWPDLDVPSDFIGKINSRNLKIFKPEYFIKENISLTTGSNPEVFRINQQMTVVTDWITYPDNYYNHGSCRQTMNELKLSSYIDNKYRLSITVDKIPGSTSNYLLKTFNKSIYVYMNKIFRYDLNLSLIKQSTIQKQAVDFAVCSKYVSFLCRNFLEIYDRKNLVLLKSINLSPKIETKFTNVYSTVSYFILKNDQYLTIMDKNENDLVKKLNLSNNFEIVSIKDDGKIWAHDRTNSKILAFYFNGEKCRQIDLEGFSSNVLIKIYEDEDFEFIEPMGKNISIFSSLIE